MLVLQGRSPVELRVSTVNPTSQTFYAQPPLHKPRPKLLFSTQKHLASGNYSYPDSHPSPLAPFEVALLYPPFTLVHNTFLTFENTGVTLTKDRGANHISCLDDDVQHQAFDVSLRPKYTESSFQCSTMYVRVCKVHARSMPGLCIR